MRLRNPFASPRPGTEVIPGVHLLGSRRVNFYAVTEGRSVTLVDCGFDGHRYYLADWLSKTGRRESDIKGVILTHGHADHFGFAERLRRGGVPVYVHPADVDSVKKPAGRNPPERLRRRLWHRSCLQLLGEALFDGVFLQPLLKEVKLLRQGQQIDLPGNPVVIPVSGHSPGSVAISLPNHGALLSGDTLMTADPMFGGSGRAIVFSEHPERDKVAVDALELLKPFGRNALLPAHGEPWLEVGSVEKAITSAVTAQ